ncbi:hypothetical protein ATE49_15560 [Elizabethkingia miricola]|uniref:Helix-turn-helix protein n=1 Tax=Elizabethkingia miricola TaxID=172045 RepID=A0ABY3NAS1_ELIMR|nr:helix-turn-helix transcriptional regulator [Elizabethkingia miricola]OBS12777.1 hypothetical protein ATE49_15560 [Elizabethkingia miricola]TYO83556.1 helix-turn-helix protein [Elizabethkingia miricola]
MHLRIKEVIKLYGTSQKEVSKKTGISEQMISYYNSGDKQPPLSKLRLIAETIGCEMTELFSVGDKYSHFYDDKTGEWLGIRKK